MAKKVFDKQKAKVWGSPDYLIMRFGDISSVRELSRKTKLATAVRSVVKGISTKADNLAAYKVYETTGEGPDGAVKQCVVHVSFGLNGSGRQVDYLEALRKLVDTGKFYIFDACIDAIDDVADVLCIYREGV